MLFNRYGHQDWERLCHTAIRAVPKAIANCWGRMTLWLLWLSPPRTYLLAQLHSFPEKHTRKRSVNQPKPGDLCSLCSGHLDAPEDHIRVPIQSSELQSLRLNTTLQLQLIKRILLFFLYKIHIPKSAQRKVSIFTYKILSITFYPKSTLTAYWLLLEIMMHNHWIVNLEGFPADLLFLLHFPNEEI